MSNDFNTNTRNNDEWLTPLYIIQSLGEFDLDPCSPEETVRPWETAKYHFSKSHDGLCMRWFGRVWCNPPYGKKTFHWLNKLALHGNGIALIFSRTETKGFHTEVLNKADAIFFFKGRVRFYLVNGIIGDRPNAASCLVAYGKNNVVSIRNSGLSGKLVEIK